MPVLNLLDDHTIELLLRLHAPLAQLPPGMLVGAMVIELVRGKRDVPRPLTSGFLLALLGTIMTMAAAAVAMAGAASHANGDSNQDAHRWTGLFTLGLAFTTLLAGSWAFFRPSTRSLGLYRSGLILTAALVCLAAYFGLVVG